MHQSERRKKAQQGYTLIELLVVLAIMGLLTTLVTTQVLHYLSSAKISAARTEVEGFSQVLELYKLDTSRYPTSQEGLAALKAAPTGVENWNGPYVRKTNELNDPWGKPYHYVSPGKHGEFDIYSYGPDSEKGGSVDPLVKNWR